MPSDTLPNHKTLNKVSSTEHGFGCFSLVFAYRTQLNSTKTRLTWWPSHKSAIRYPVKVVSLHLNTFPRLVTPAHHIWQILHMLLFGAVVKALHTSRVRILEVTPNAGWVCCWFSPLLRENFLQRLLQRKTYPCPSNTEELLSILGLTKYHYMYIKLCFMWSHKQVNWRWVSFLTYLCWKIDYQETVDFRVQSLQHLLGQGSLTSPHRSRKKDRSLSLKQAIHQEVISYSVHSGDHDFVEWCTTTKTENIGWKLDWLLAKLIIHNINTLDRCQHPTWKRKWFRDTGT